MKLNDKKIVVAIENTVCEQLEASGIKADPIRLDGEKIVDVILEQLDGYLLVPKKPTRRMIDAAMKDHEGDAFLPYSIYRSFVKAAQEQGNE